MREEMTSEELDALQGVDELNIAEFPLAVLTQRPQGRSVSYSNYITDRKTREKVHRELTIIAPDGTNLPTAFDANVVLALLQFKDRIDEKGYQTFSLREIARILGLKEAGSSLQRIKTAVKSYFKLELEYKNAWYDAYNEEWRTAHFRIINDVEFSESGEYKIQWSDRFLSNIQQNYLKPLDLNLFRSLKNPIAQTLYRFLDKKFFHNKSVDYSLENLVFNHLGFPRGSRSYVSAIKSRIEPAIEELEDKNFIDRDPERIYKRGREWRIRFHTVGALKKNTQIELFADSKEDQLRKRMLEQGFSNSQCEKLLKEEGYEKVYRLFEIVMFRKFEGNAKIRTVPGYMSTMIDDDPEYPEDYVSEQDRIERERQRIEQKQADQQVEDAKRAEADAELEQMTKRVDKFLDGLGEEAAMKFLKKHKLIQNKDVGCAMWYLEVEDLLEDLGL